MRKESDKHSTVLRHCSITMRITSQTKKFVIKTILLTSLLPRRQSSSKIPQYNSYHTFVRCKKNQPLNIKQHHRIMHFNNENIQFNFICHLSLQTCVLHRFCGLQKRTASNVCENCESQDLD